MAHELNLPNTGFQTASRSLSGQERNQRHDIQAGAIQPCGSSPETNEDAQ